MEQIIIREDGTKVLQTTVQQPVVTTVSVADLTQKIGDMTTLLQTKQQSLLILQDDVNSTQAALDALNAQLSDVQIKLADPLIPVTDLQTVAEPVTVGTVETVQPTV